MNIPSPDPALFCKDPANVKKVRKIIAGIKYFGCIVTHRMQEIEKSQYEEICKKLYDLGEDEVLSLYQKGMWKQH